MTQRAILTACASLLVAACASPTIREPSSAHMKADNTPVAPGGIPQPVTQALPLPKPRPAPRAETYSVVVNNVKVHDLLFALARDARLNVDIHPGLNGHVTLNAIDQTLPQLLNRIAKQVDMRFEIDGPNLTVMPDQPFLRNYPVDYVNMSREATSSVTVNTQLVGISGGSGGGSGSGGGGGGSGGQSSAAAGANNSTTKVENKAKNLFWDNLTQNIKDLLKETDKEKLRGRTECEDAERANTSTRAESSGSANATARQGSEDGTAKAEARGSASTAADAARSRERNCKNYEVENAAAVIAHPETGVISVRATSRQHEKIQEFIDRVQNSARRQVMIEATIVEVQLSNKYQQGIEWSQLATRIGFGTTLTPAAIAGAGVFSLTYRNEDFSGTIRLLDDFGTTKVLSSPKISVLNNQTAVLKVVDNEVYFTIEASTSQNQNTTITTYTTTLHQVPVGFVMNVTPQISDSDTVLLNVRPSISRVIGYVQDPNPALRRAINLSEDIKSEIPVIRMREMESMLRVQNGNVAVMGGLMEDALQKKDQTVPGLGSIPLFGELFNQRDDTARKTELVIFLRPTVVRDASIGGDYANLKGFLPKQDFFTKVPDPQNPGDKANYLRRDP